MTIYIPIILCCHLNGRVRIPTNSKQKRETCKVTPLVSGHSRVTSLPCGWSSFLASFSFSFGFSSYMTNHHFPQIQMLGFTSQTRWHQINIWYYYLKEREKNQKPQSTTLANYSIGWKSIKKKRTCLQVELVGFDFIKNPI